MKLRHVVIAHDTKLLETWDHTSSLMSSIYSLTTVVVNAVSSKAKLKPRPPSHFHPYRERKQTGGLKITPQNAESSLWMLGNYLTRKS